MFKRIKLRIIKGRKLKPFEVAKVLQEHEDKIALISGDDVTELADIKALKETIGDEDSGLVKDVNGIKTTIGDSNSGLVKDAADLDARVEVLEAFFSHDLSFTVDDGTDPVQGAVVTIEGKTGTTGSAGGCTIEDILEGSHTVAVTADGFEDYSDTISVTSDDTSFTISLTAASP